jgi:hypothetical protein
MDEDTKWVLSQLLIGVMLAAGSGAIFALVFGF